MSTTPNRDKPIEVTLPLDAHAHVIITQTFNQAFLTLMHPMMECNNAMPWNEVTLTHATLFRALSGSPTHASVNLVETTIYVTHNGVNHSRVLYRGGCSWTYTKGLQPTRNLRTSTEGSEYTHTLYGPSQGSA